MTSSDENSPRRFTRIGKPRVRGGPEETPNDIAIIQEALASAIEGAKAEDWDTVWYVTSNNAALKKHDIHEEALGAATFTAMQTPAGAQIDGITLRSVGVRELAGKAREGVLLVMYPDADMLQRVDAFSWDHGAVVVPWIDQPQSWNDEWGATNL